MKLNLLLLLLAVFLITTFSSNRNIIDKELQIGDFYKTTDTFIKLTMKFDTLRLRTFLRENAIKDYIHGFNYDIETLNNYINKYGLPQKSSWLVQYDTVQRLTKFVHIIVPIFDGYDKKSRLKKAYLKLTFDYTGHFLPSNRIVDYDLVKEFKP